MTSITDLTLFHMKNKKISSFIEYIPTSVKALDLSINPEINDLNLKFIGENLTKLKYLKLYNCTNITSESLILKKCKLLNVGFTKFSSNFMVNNLNKIEKGKNPLEYIRVFMAKGPGISNEIFGKYLASMVNLEELHILVPSVKYINDYILPLQNLKILNIEGSPCLRKSKRSFEEYKQNNLSHVTVSDQN